MTVSGITSVVRSDIVLDTGAFIRQNYTWVVWSVSAPLGSDQLLRWRRSDQTEFQYVEAKLRTRYWNFVSIYRSSDDALVVFYDTDAGETDTGSKIYTATFDLLTGNVTASAQSIASGFKPSVVYRGGVPGNDIILTYANRAKGSVYCRQSIDGGAFWSAERPVLTNKVRTTTDVVAVSHDSNHLSVLQVGSDARPLKEMGIWNHSRPLGMIIKHPNVNDRYLVAESNQRVITAVNQLTENTHGALIATQDNAAVLQGFGDRIGTDDGINPLIYLDTSAPTPTVSSSLALTQGANPAGELARATIAGAPSFDRRIQAFTGGEIIQCVTVSANYAYLAAGSDVGSNLGSMAVMRLSDYTLAYPLTGISSVRCACTATASGTTYIFLATLASGIEKVRIYLENGLSPTNAGYLDHKMPSTINNVMAVLDSPTSGMIYVAMSDRFHIYKFNGPTVPLQLYAHVPALTSGGFYHMVMAANGNIVCARGASGVSVIKPDGEVVAQSAPVGVIARPWLRSTYYPTGSFVIPNSSNIYAPNRTYFKATSGGTSGTLEPKWVASPTSITDSSVTWVEQSVTSAVVTAVAVDQTQKRIYAAGVLGGVSGVAGRVWAFDASGGVI
jgi:hypothetical protein